MESLASYQKSRRGTGQRTPLPPLVQGVPNKYRKRLRTEFPNYRRAQLAENVLQFVARQQKSEDSLQLVRTVQEDRELFGRVLCILPQLEREIVVSPLVDPRLNREDGPEIQREHPEPVSVSADAEAQRLTRYKSFASLMLESSAEGRRSESWMAADTRPYTHPFSSGW